MNKKQSDCYSLYLKHDGRNHSQIEAEMRVLGYKKFNRRCLYARTVSGTRTEGWIKRFDWEPNGTRTSLSAFPPDDFQAWLAAACPQWRWDLRHQKFLYKKLKQITSGENKRLMIFMPPRHGKSELVTVRYAAWRIQQDPSLNIIIGSYGQKLANKFSRKIRNVLAEEGEKAGKGEGEKRTEGDEASNANAATNPSPALPFAPSPSLKMFPRMRPANTVAEWETHAGGGVRAVGVGAGVTGYGARLVIIDDPVKSRAQAESRTFRSRVWDWFNDDIYTRLEPDAAMILIQTRWHEDDLAGRLLKQMQDGGEQWDVVNLPALARRNARLEPATDAVASAKIAADKDVRVPSTAKKLPSLIRRGGSEAGGVVEKMKKIEQTHDQLNRTPGEALWPERFGTDELDRIKRQIGSYSFSALYQQDPAPLDGGLFKKDWFKKIIDRAPENLRWCRGYDLAVSTSSAADYTASFRCAEDAEGNLYIADGFRARIEYPDQRRYVRERMQEEKSTAHGIEKALHGLALVQDITRDRQLFHRPIKCVNIDSDKFTRALAWAARAENGKVILVRGAWIDEFLDEICRFPSGRHDDQIDAVSTAVRMIAQYKGKGMVGMDYK